MERFPVSNSSSIAEVGYDAGTETLEIMFTNGNVYVFFEVPEDVAVGLTSPWTSSVGQYFETRIRNSYSYVKS